MHLYQSPVLKAASHIADGGVATVPVSGTSIFHTVTQQKYLEH
jgi:hypothetical protein